MIPTPGYVYFIKDEFFNLFEPMADGKLCFNKGPEHMRPYFCSMKDRGSNLFWMVPMTTQCEKYYSWQLNKFETYGKCITITMTRYAGHNSALLIQNAVPVHPEFIDSCFLVKGKPRPLHIAAQHMVHGNLLQSFAIKNRGRHIFFANVDHIKEAQIALEKKGFPIPLDSKISSATERAAQHCSHAKQKAREYTH